MRALLPAVLIATASCVATVQSQTVEIQTGDGPLLQRRAALDGDALDQVIDRIISREHYENAILSYFHPVIETQIQDEREHGEEEVAWRKWDLEGRANIRPDTLSVHAFHGKNPDVGYAQVGFLQEAFIDRDGFDRLHYSFRYLGEEKVGGTDCFVFDITPFSAVSPGRFRGRIWANEQDYTIVRFTGSYMPMHQWDFTPTPHRVTFVFANFDSRRSSVEPGMWLPSYITTERKGMQEGRQKWDFTSRTEFSDFGSTAVTAKIPPYDQARFQKTIVPRPTLGKSFWIPWSVNLGLMMTANAITAHCLALRQCIEADPLFGRHPSAAEVYSVRLSLFATTFFMAAREKKNGQRFLWRYSTYLPMYAYAIDDVQDVKNVLEHGWTSNNPAPSLQTSRDRKKEK